MSSPLSLLRGCIAFAAMVLNTLFWVVPILCLSIVKLLPLSALRTGCTYLLDACASAWISVNGFIGQIFHPIKVHLSGDTQLSTKDWYMVIANHQSWVDILILQKVLNRRIPFLKFFLKQELLYVPVLGLAWWALDFPFMRRYSTAQLKKNPKLRGKDIEITRKACEKFKTKPVSIMNFVEGTRFTQAKYQKQKPPFQHLLRPKAGGLAFALSAMGEQIHKLVDITIHYPDSTPSFWDYISGQQKEVYVDIKVREIEPAMRGDYIKDREFKQDFQEQLNQLWQHKDLTYNQLAQVAIENNKAT